MLVGLSALLIFAVTFKSSTAIFEDQVGKFDWRQQYVGCVHQLRLEHAKPTKSDLIFVSTEAQVLAALRSNTGNIAWRQLHEENSTSPLMFALRNKMVISLAKNGEVVRAWEREGGAMVWQTQIHSAPVRSISLLASSEGSVFVLDEVSLTALSLSNGQLKWSSQLDANKEWLGVVQGSQSVTVIGGVRDQQVAILRFDSHSASSPKTQSITANWFNKQRCALSSTVLVCYDSVSMHVIDVSSDPAAVQTTAIEGISELIPLQVDGFVAARSRGTLLLFSLAPSQPPKLILSLESADAVSSVRTPDGRDLLGVLSNAFELSVYQLSTGTRVLHSRLPYKDRAAPIKQFSFTIALREWEFVTVGDDCRMDLFVASPSPSPELLLEWSRHEALSTISSIQMIDLPLSEAQAGIEWEFIADGGVMESLIRRLYSQASQLHKALVKAAQRILAAPSAVSLRSKSFADWMASLRSSASHRDVAKEGTSLERDYFNLRKLILVATRKSTLYGLDSNDGSILWRMYVGRDLAPLKDSAGIETVPLFVQRSTAHYHYSALAVIAMLNKHTRNGVLVQFDPISGKLIERVDLPYRIKRVDMLSVLDKQDVHPLLIVDNANKVRTYPAKTSLDAALTNRMHMFDVQTKGHLAGYRLNTNAMQLERVWGVDLRLSPHQSIVTVSTKPANQRVHSAGKVLGDRSVLYKYSNPNLVVVAVLDSVHNTLHIHLIDAVNGYIVHSAKQTKVSGPVHIVQCENWVTYSYWNDKSRRMEIAVLELFEGEEQTDEHSFNSFTPALPPLLRVLSQAYIFPQGISALAVTETEQGLSTRSVLVAMPFGGVYGISKRVIDARRPLEMTAELAEEMLIPYRPELPIASEDFVNYNQSVFNIRAIKTTASGLESTSLMLAYGLDLFFARITPSGTFDILKDDFDHLLISVVLVALVLGSLLCKRIGRNHSLKQAWQ